MDNPWIEKDVREDSALGAYTALERQSVKGLPVETCSLCQEPMHMDPGVGFYRCVGCGAVRVTRKINGEWIDEDRR